MLAGARYRTFLNCIINKLRGMSLSINVYIKILMAVLLSIFFYGCHYSDDTLGGWPERTFPISKKKIGDAINRLYKENPEYRVPDKWKYEDSSIRKAYFFLPSITFYFKGDPEEMYYVTFIGDDAMLADPSQITISIRLMNSGGSKWFKYIELNMDERKRIQARFDKEIISKLELYTKTNAEKLNQRN
jgi:hypothetical protein